MQTKTSQGKATVPGRGNALLRATTMTYLSDSRLPPGAPGGAAERDLAS
jgi:hypothetical protein